MSQFELIASSLVLLFCVASAASCSDDASSSAEADLTTDGETDLLLDAAFDLSDDPILNGDADDDLDIANEEPVPDAADDMRGETDVTSADADDAAGEDTEADSDDANDLQDGDPDLAGSDVDADDASDASDASDAEVDASTVHPNVAFVTSTQQAPGSLGGFEGADEICQQLAEGAELPENTYVAYLASPEVTIRTRLGDARGWVLPNGRPFADTVDDLLDGVDWYLLSVDESGERLSESSVNGYVLTSTNASGGFVGGHCDDWTDAEDETLVQGGRAQSGGFQWATGLGLSCGDPRHLYCLGVDEVAPQDPPMQDGRRAFLSSSTVLPGTEVGLAGLDAICQADADSNGMGDATFLALASTTSASAASRFDTTEESETWVRLDGVQLFETAADLASSTSELLAALNLEADGTTRNEDRAWTGGPDPTALGTDESTCDDWLQSSESTGFVGQPRYGWQFFRLFISGPVCNSAYRVYCLET